MERKFGNGKVQKNGEESEMEKHDAEDYADEEAMESYGEESDFGPPAVGSCLYPATLRDSPEDSETESISTSTDQTDSHRAKWEKALRMKWMTVTGKKPLSMPLTVIYKPKTDKEAKGELVSFFGDRRPLMIEKRRKEDWMNLKMKKEMSRSYGNMGRVLREIRLREVFCGVRCLRFSPLSDTMISTYGNGVVQVRNPETGEVTLTLQTLETLYRLEVMTARYHPRNNGKVYVGGGCGVIQVFDVNNPKCIGSVRDLSPDGSLLISIGKDGNVYVYDAHKLRLVSLQSKPAPDETTLEKELSYHHMRLYGLRYHPRDPNIFVTGGWDYTVKVWDTRVCGAVNSIHGPRICGDSIDLRENEILTGSWSATNSLKLWDLSSGRVLRHISASNRSSPVDGEFIYVAKFFDGIGDANSIVVGGNGTEEVEVINIDNNMVVASFPAMKAVTALDSYGNTVAYGGMESVLRIGDLNNTRTALQSPKKSVSERKRSRVDNLRELGTFGEREGPGRRSDRDMEDGRTEDIDGEEVAAYLRRSVQSPRIGHRRRKSHFRMALLTVTAAMSGPRYGGHAFNPLLFWDEKSEEAKYVVK